MGDQKATCQHVQSDYGNIVANFVSQVSKEGLSFADFVEVVLNMRGTNPATVKDVEKQMKVMKSTMKGLLDDLQSSVCETVDALRVTMTEVKHDMNAMVQIDSSDSE